MKKYFIQTFGCAMNQADSEKINMMFLQSGFMRAPNWSDADILIFNTCSVRQKGEDRVFGMLQDIKKHNKKHPERPVSVGITGCMVRKTGLAKRYLEDIGEAGETVTRNSKQAKKIYLLDNKEGIFNYDDSLFLRSDYIDFVFRIEEIQYVPHILTHMWGERIGADDKFDDYLKQAQHRENAFSVNIIIQTGCDNYCSFCIVPYTRGKEISRPMEDIIQEAREAVANGAKEINLIGQNVNSYGKQFVDQKLWNSEKSAWDQGIGKSPFRQLLEKLDEIEGLNRIRFTSSNPHDMTQDILDAHFDLKSTCNYLHFALQSGDDAMLKRMNRRHSYTDFKKIVDYLRSRDPLFAISTDIIVGYSGETDEMFENTVKAFSECQFDFSYTARYSVRKDTLASKIYPDDVEDGIKAARWHILNDLLLDTVTQRNEKMLDRVEDILVIGQKDGMFFGRTRNFKEVFFDATNSELHPGDIVPVKITQLDRYVLRGEIFNK